MMAIQGAGAIRDDAGAFLQAIQSDAVRNPDLQVAITALSAYIKETSSPTLKGFIYRSTKPQSETPLPIWHWITDVLHAEKMSPTIQLPMLKYLMRQSPSSLKDLHFVLSHALAASNFDFAGDLVKENPKLLPLDMKRIVA